MLAAAAAKLDEYIIPAGVGIGITDRAPYRVTDIVEGGAAALTGELQINDYIMSVAGVDITNRTFTDVKSLILGEPGTQLTLKVDRRTDDGQHQIFSTIITRSTPASQDASAITRSRLSGSAALQPAGARLVNMPAVEPSPFPSRPPPPFNLPSVSPASLLAAFERPDSFDTSGST